MATFQVVGFAAKNADVRDEVAQVDRDGEPSDRPGRHDAAVGRHQAEASAQRQLAGDHDEQADRGDRRRSRLRSERGHVAGRMQRRAEHRERRSARAPAMLRSTIDGRRRMTVSTTTSVSLASRSSPVSRPVSTKSTPRRTAIKVKSDDDQHAGDRCPRSRAAPGGRSAVRPVAGSRDRRPTVVESAASSTSSRCRSPPRCASFLLRTFFSAPCDSVSSRK